MADQSSTSRRLLLPKAGKKKTKNAIPPIQLASFPNPALLRPWLGSLSDPWAPPVVTFCQQLILGFSIFLQDKLNITRCIMHDRARRNRQTWKEEEEYRMEKTNTKRHKKALQRQKQLGICACWRSGRRWNFKAPTHSCSFYTTKSHTLGFGGF